MNPPFNMDERNFEITRRICARLYLVTLMLLMGSMGYRQYVLGQETGQFEDMALIFTFNVLILLGALCYYGGITLPKIKPVPLLGVYIGEVSEDKGGVLLVSQARSGANGRSRKRFCGLANQYVFTLLSKIIYHRSELLALPLESRA